MIFNGIKLLIHPRQTWERHLSNQSSHATSLAAAAFSAAVLPTTAVVLGHLFSAKLGFTDHTTAIQRAAIGFVSVSIGALVMIPSLALLLLRIGTNARIDMTSEKASAAAMALVWATWICGVIMMLPPLLNLRPELGEFAWYIIGLFAAWRVLSQSVGSGLKVSRRWRNRFQFEALVAFSVLFIAVPILPPLLMRTLVGVTGQVIYGAPPDILWPHPPTPEW